MFKKIALTAAVVSMFSVPAFANFGSGANENILKEGSTASTIINSGQPHTYQINLDQPTTVRIASSHFPGMNSILPMKAKLIDAQGDTVKEVSSYGGDFEIREALRAGQYRLVVSGNSAPGGDSWDVHRYSLHVAFQ
ncbi:hypothetical protein HNO51_06280 [Billgrantia sulfidoxydans]|uniref:Uncharacterized protein n=1 Tax=Billgrantia sulfidoxydans TaxID=2733484 RepID=A0ABX7W5P2_9GAMM|nr:hypothetical protein [Halomonas sulfidoxydans]QTP54328.1 hypothetical protein HNO51_06280 [Halomonas sulfidoxydans]